MQKFSDFVKNDNISNEDINNSSENIKTKEDMQSKIDKYSSYSSDRLLNEFMKLTLEKKKRGELSDSELEKLKNTILPMLNTEQIQSLENLIQMVKNVK